MKETTVQIEQADQLKSVNGVLIFTASVSLGNEDFVEQSRDERIDDLTGGIRKDR